MFFQKLAVSLLLALCTGSVVRSQALNTENSTSTVCSKSEVYLDVLQTEYVWEIDGVPDFMEAMNLCSKKARNSVDFKTNISNIQLFQKLNAMWSFSLNIKKNSARHDYVIIAVEQQFTNLDMELKNYDVFLESALTLSTGNKSLATTNSTYTGMNAPSHQTVYDYNNYSNGVYTSSNIRKWTWTLDFNKFLHLFDDQQANQKNESAQEDELLVMHRIRMTKPVSELSTRNTTQCNYPSFKSIQQLSA